MSEVFYGVPETEVLPYVKDVSGFQLSTLKKAVRGGVYTRGDANFKAYSRCFNGALSTPACILVTPLDANDVSEVVLFCNRNGFTPSIKSGGYGTHGLSIEGDVILDMQNMAGISLSTENVPMAGSTQAMEGVEEAPTGPGSPRGFLFAREPYPQSKIDVNAPPDILKRRRDEAFGSDDGEDEDSAGAPVVSPSSTAVGSSSRPSVASLTGTARDMSSSASASGSDSKQSSFRPTSDIAAAKSHIASSRRTRARYTSPDNVPASLGGTMSSILPPSGSQTGSPAVAHPMMLDIPRPLNAEERREIISASGSAGSGSGSTPSRFGGLDAPSPPTSIGSDPKGPATARVALTDAFGYGPNPASLGPALLSADRGAPVGSMSPVDVPPAPRGPFDYAAPPVATPPATDQLGMGGNDFPVMGGGGASSSFPLHPIDPRAPFAYYTIGCGANQRTVDSYAAANPLPGISASGEEVMVPYYIPGAAFPVGSAFMVLGGFGFQTRLRGLSIDCLVEVEMVLADGKIIVVNEDEYPDLFWAMRGAGTAYGIVTRYKMKAFPISVVFAGNIVYEFHQSTAASLIKHFRDCVKSAPPELYANVILTAGPRNNGALVVIQICWIGTKDGGLPFLQAIMSWSGDQCLLNEVNEKTFAHQQDSIAKVLKPAAGRKWFLRSDVITSLTDEMVHQTVDKFAGTPDGCAWLFELAGGVLPDCEGTCVPGAVRKGVFNVVAFHQWQMKEVDLACVETAEEWMKNTIYPLSAGGPYPSFLERKELVTRTIGAYGQENWDKLVVLKRKYDPRAIFRHNFWPLEDDGKPIGTLTDELDGIPEASEPPQKTAEPSKVSGKGKGKIAGRHGNHFMDRFLRP
ncbi:hypothetical protein FRB94_013535 [Tulasnella sp. JGI-2019a]|nr:hypothetical protein FRB93_005119 [Tulasnella sp. JGI-2019a]KAG9014225.1 hypothetical protein FRB94_013535 [Tulasnella sp. JGI-2019a]